MVAKNKQFFNTISNEITTKFQNKSGNSVLVYVNWELRDKNQQKHSKMIIKVRTNRFIKIKDGSWKRIIDFKETLCNEFYIAIDSPIESKGFFQSQESKESLTVDQLHKKFGVDIYFIWKKFIDMHCSWSTEDVYDAEGDEIPPEYLD